MEDDTPGARSKALIGLMPKAKVSATLTTALQGRALRAGAAGDVRPPADDVRRAREYG